MTHLDETARAELAREIALILARNWKEKLISSFPMFYLFTHGYMVFLN